MLGHFALSQDLVLGHFALSQEPTPKRWGTSNCPKTLLPRVGTLHTVPRSSVQTPRTVPRPYTQVLGHFSLSQDLSLKCWDTSYCPKTLSLKCWDTPHYPKISLSSVGTLRTVPRPFHSSVGTLRTVPRPFHPSDGTLHTVPRLPTQVLGHAALSQGCLLKYSDSSYCPQTSSFQCWDSRISSSSVLGHLDHYPRYHHLSPNVKNSPKPNLTDQNSYLKAPL